MKKTYIKPEVRVLQIVAPRIMTASGDIPYVEIKKDKGNYDDIYAEEGDEVLSRRSTNLWDDFEEEEW